MSWSPYKHSFDRMNSAIHHYERRDSNTDDDASDDRNVFSKKAEGPDFRGVTCIGAAVLIAKAQFGLGVLGLPFTMEVLGLVPGVICLIVLCAFSIWSGVVVGRFRLSRPEVYSVGDATLLMFGKIGCELMGIGFWLFYTLCYGAALLTFTIAFNTITSHVICSVGWLGVGAAIAMILGTLMRTMKVISWCSYVAVVSVFSAVWIVTIATLAEPIPANAPSGMPVNRHVRIFGTGSSYASIATAVGTQLLSLCGTASFFPIHAEMKEQKKYILSLYLGQAFVVFNYIATSCIIYGRVGQFVVSPALGSAGILIKKICYGIALPELIFSSFFQAHIAAKYALVRLLRDTDHLQSNSMRHWATWVSMMTITIGIGLVIAGAIPFFNSLLGLIGSLFGSSFMLIIPGFMSLYEITDVYYEPGDKSMQWLMRCGRACKASRKNILITATAVFAIAVGIYIMITGVYGAITSIVDAYEAGGVGGAFSCQDNSLLPAH
ncbi:hypothetical protein TRVA0_029S00100 [Trichomonascus vanleenenianus]|uniref:uncharacterized protein n=1 Tax=Trichomonascus vanleenenianus TaxID=2268995 RepID=UPI003ECB0E0A